MKWERMLVDPAEVARSREKDANRDLRLEGGEGGAKAIVRTETEREVVLLPATDVEGARALEGHLVAIGGTEPAEDELARGDGHALHGDVAGREPRIHLDGRGEAQHLL